MVSMELGPLTDARMGGMRYDESMFRASFIAHRPANGRMEGRDDQKASTADSSAQKPEACAVRVVGFPRTA